MTDPPNDPPDTFDMSEDTIMSNEPEKPAQDTPVQPAVPKRLRVTRYSARATMRGTTARA